MKENNPETSVMIKLNAQWSIALFVFKRYYDFITGQEMFIMGQVEKL